VAQLDIGALAKLGVLVSYELNAVHAALSVEYDTALAPIAVGVHPDMSAG
jgi:hypothetical protein